MPQVGIAAGAQHLDPVHAVAEVLGGGDRCFAHRRPVAGPTAAGVELGVGIEQGGIAADAVIDARSVLAVILAGKGPFGSLQSTDLKLGLGQLFSPGLLAFFQFVHIFLREVWRPGFLRRRRRKPEIGRALSELQSRPHLVCRLLLEKKKKQPSYRRMYLPRRPSRSDFCHYVLSSLGSSSS